MSVGFFKSLKRRSINCTDDNKFVPKKKTINTITHSIELLEELLLRRLTDRIVDIVIFFCFRVTARFDPSCDLLLVN